MADLLEHFPRHLLQHRPQVGRRGPGPRRLSSSAPAPTTGSASGSFSETRLREFRRRVSRPVATSYGPFGVSLGRFAPRLLAEMVLRGRGDAFQVPHRVRGATVVTEGFVDRAHAAGRPVHVWTVDDPDEMRDAARPRGRRTDDRPDRRAARGPGGPRAVEGDTMTDVTSPGGIANLEPLARQRQQKAWNWYDWANSAYYTTVLSVMFAPYMITVAGRAAGCVDADETCTKTVSLLGLQLAAGLAAVLPDQLRDDRQRVPAAGRRRLRRPVGTQEAAHGRVRLGRRPSSPRCCSSCRATTGRSVPWHRAEQRARRLLAGQLLRDPGGHLHRGGARPGLLAGLGVGLPRRRAAAPGQPGDVPRPRRARPLPGPGGAALAAVRGPLVGVVHADPGAPAAQLRAAARAGRARRPAAAQLRPAVHHAAGDARLPDDADLPARVPVLQRRHPDGDRRRGDVRLQAARLRSSRC